MESMAKAQLTDSHPPQINAQYLRLLEVMPAAAYTTDAAGCITYFNQRAVDLWGREPKLSDPIDRY
ncbi:MAG: PAS domain-containing protein [Gemmataceae bacterium]